VCSWFNNPDKSTPCKILATSAQKEDKRKTRERGEIMLLIMATTLALPDKMHKTESKNSFRNCHRYVSILEFSFS
jgi:hypothetical protein